MTSINRERFLERLYRQGEIGWREGEGLFRAAYSGVYNEARDYIEKAMREAGLTTRTDAVGNLFGRLEGSDPESPALLVGSHLDAVKAGGIYDGPLGIVAGIEALQCIGESGVAHRHPCEVVAFTAEEGGPLGGTFGSRVFAGQLPTSPAAEALDSCGLSPDDLNRAKADLSRYAAYLELHIEQGPVLWRKGIPIGIPTGIVGITRYRTTITGEQNHAGTTPMGERQDALYEAVELLHQWLSAMRERDDCVCNVGTFNLEPGFVSIVPGRVSFDLEVRSLDAAVTEETVEHFKRLAGELPHCTAETDRLVAKPPVHLDDRMQDAVETASRNCGYASLRMPSGASHDASPIAQVLPAGMVFVPSVGGVSHAREEHTEAEGLVHGAEVVLGSLLEMDRLFG
ncbi:MAG: M20 family metallo-hydrolase [Synergistales bacterium]|nr:M20 family metallo-hydrolase [Synergistales bacterium]